MNQMNYDGIDIKGNKYIFTEIKDYQKRHINQQYKELTAIAPVNILGANNQHNYGNQYWLFQCSCGNKICKLFSSVSSNQKAPDCGHTRLNERINKQIGKTYNYLTIIALDNEYKKINHIKSNAVYYKCQCKCGNYKTVRITALTSGEVKSCGCLKKEQEKVNLKRGITLIDLTGRRFGMLTVLERALDVRDAHNAYWRCQCDCGQIKIINGASLRDGSSTSCGCKIMSEGEAKIKDILDRHNIQYIFNAPYFRDLIGINGGICRYDFIILNELLQPIRLIEFDGQQHFKDISYFYSSYDFEDRQKNDEIKNNYAKLHNLPLVRIPYTEINNLTFDNLFDNTYIIKE